LQYSKSSLPLRPLGKLRESIRGDVELRGERDIVLYGYLGWC